MTPTIGQQIREARFKAKLTIEELHKATKVSVGCISEIEQGKANPRYSTLRRLANGMGLTKLTIRF